MDFICEIETNLSSFFLVEAVFLVSAKLTAALPILVVALVTICVKASICALGEDLAFLHLFIIRVHN